MVLVKDKAVKKLLLETFDEELEQLKQAKRSGRFTPAQFKIRKDRIMSKKKLVRAGKYDL